MGRKKALLSVAIILTGLITTIQGISAANASSIVPVVSTSPPVRAVSSARGEDLFQALYFGVGPAVGEVKSRLHDRAYERFLSQISQLSEQQKLTTGVTKAILQDDKTLLVLQPYLW